MRRTVEWIAAAVNGRLVGSADLEVTAVVTDSREATPGALYVARRGESSDGHDYIDAAISNGAVALVVEKERDDCAAAQIVVEESTVALGHLAHAHLEDLRASGDIEVVAVTGSAGKTTTKDLLAQILGAKAPTVAPKLSFNNEVGLPLTVLTAEDTTRYLVLEMGASGAGHLRYLTDIAAPDIAIELMVGHAHLGGFGSVEGIAQAKAELVEGLRPHGTAILNADDSYVRAMADKAPARVRSSALRAQMMPTTAPKTSRSMSMTASLSRFAPVRKPLPFHSNLLVLIMCTMRSQQPPHAVNWAWASKRSPRR